MDGPQTYRELAHWLALLRAPTIQISLLHDLLGEFETPENIFGLRSKHLAQFGLKEKHLDYFVHPDWNGVKADLEWLEAPDNFLVTYFDDDYPVLLKEIHDPPLALFVTGDRSILCSLQVSIVGSRRPTPDGKRNARRFSSQLAGLGVTITSGLASGLDTEAHRGALDVNGKTIAVLGNGLKCIYPPGNEKLSHLITENGALVSEFLLDDKPLAANFPRRNRIISGLATGTLVVEAAVRSGTLITARLAMEQGREVFAIPGSIHNHLAKGCHNLIRQGAKLVENIEDILEEVGPLGHLTGNSRQEYSRDGKKIKGLDECSKLLLDYIGSQPVSIDFLVEESRLTARDVLILLIKMEMAGIVEALPGGRYVRIQGTL